MAALQQPDSELRRGGAQLVAHALQAGIKAAVDEAALGSSLSVTVALRDAAARLCTCAGVGVEALLAAAPAPVGGTSVPSSSTSTSAAAAAPGLASSSSSSSGASAAAEDAYAQRLRGVALVLHDSAALLARKGKREGGGDDEVAAGSGGGAPGAASQRLLDTDPAAAACHGPATALLRVCAAQVSALKRQVLAGMAASKADRDAHLVAGTLPAAARVGHDSEIVRQLYEPCAELCRAALPLVLAACGAAQ